MVRRLAVAFSAFLLVPAYASDVVYPGGGVFAQVNDGAGSSTTLTLVNLDSLAAQYTLYFYNDDGTPWTTLSTTGPLSGTLPPLGSAIIKTNGGGSAQLQGWAYLSTPYVTDVNGLGHYTIAGTAVFTIALPGNANLGTAPNPAAQATVPLDTGYDSVFAIPFDHAVTSFGNSAVFGVALANTWQQTTALTVNVVAKDLSGATIPTAVTSIQLPGNGHTSFLLTDKFPELAGKQGVVVFSPVVSDTTNNPYGLINALGLRANAEGTSLSTVAPLIPCYYVSNANGTGCTN